MTFTIFVLVAAIVLLFRQLFQKNRQLHIAEQRLLEANREKSELRYKASALSATNMHLQNQLNYCHEVNGELRENVSDLQKLRCNSQVLIKFKKDSYKFHPN